MNKYSTAGQATDENMVQKVFDGSQNAGLCNRVTSLIGQVFISYDR
jgi:hypothetical protein